MIITAPQDSVVCVGEDFVLSISIPEEGCDTLDFTFLWDPEDCIVSGQGTATIVANIMEDKTFQVLVTHEATGEDSLYAIDIEVKHANASNFGA